MTKKRKVKSIEEQQIGEKIKDLRLSQGLNQTEFGKKYHLSQNDVTNIESGYKTVSYKLLLEIAKDFSVTTDYLIKENGVKSNDKDLQYICDYTGLEEEAVKVLRNATHGADDFFEQPTEEYTKFIQEQRKAINGFLKSDFFSDLVECFIIQQSVNQKVNDKLTHIKTDESEKAKYLLYRTATNIDLKDEQDLNIYRAQTTILDYLRTLQTYTQDDFRFISNYYFEKGMNDYFAENPQNEKGENDE